MTRLGLGTTADAANPFSAKLNGALWTALTTWTKIGINAVEANDQGPSTPRQTCSLHP